MKIVESLLPDLPPSYFSAPHIRIETDIPDVDEYEVRICDLPRGHRLVAAIALVSPANKDRHDTRQAFVAKFASLLQQEVSVTIVDVVTTHGFNLNSALLTFLGQADSALKATPTNIYAATSRGTRPCTRWLLKNRYQPLAISTTLPTFSLWLTNDLAISLDLEASHEETCRVLRIG